MPIELSDLQGSRVAILGFGVNNQALTEWLVNNGMKVTVCDENKQAKETNPKLIDKVSWQLGESAFSNLAEFNYLFRTPGLRPDHPAIVEAQSRGGAILTSQTELFFALSPCPIIGITGTKGKGTTASLIFSMLKEGRADLPFNNIYLAGNIGSDPFEFLEKLKKGDIVILELSSFQLFQAQVKPKVAVVLSLTPDHLDYHQNEHEYVAAKTYLVRNQTSEDIAVLHQESEHLNTFTSLTRAQIYTYSRQSRVNRGAYVGQLKNKKAIFITGEEEPLLLAKDLSLPGEHNLENAAAASLVAYLLGVSRRHLRAAAKSFQGLPHRLQEVAEIKGVKFIDDSIATTPEATIAAIEAFADHPIHLLAGGVSKGANYENMAKIAEKKCQSVTLMGQNATQIAKEFSEKPLKVANMEEAVRSVLSKVKSGDVVLLSSASASFDRYSNYAERGEDFITRVKSNRQLIK